MPSHHTSLIKGISAFVLWGLFPVYFKLVSAVSPLEVLLYRIIFSFPFMFLYIFFRKNINKALYLLIRRPKAFIGFINKLAHQFYETLVVYKSSLILLFITGFLITVNWFVFIAAVYVDRILETSLGYFISPLLTILGSLVFFNEKLSRIKQIALGMTACAVLIKAIHYGAFPFIAIMLAGTFSGYGLIKKHIQKSRNASVMFMIETSLFFPISLIVLYFIGSGIFTTTEHSHSLKLLVIGLGIVTVVPLLLFNQAVQQLDMSRIGFIQYLTPSISFILAISFYKEPFTLRDLMIFMLIWTALFLVGFEDYHRRRKQKA
ncbi:protein RarD [Spirochaetota bacterium]|nr:protein RarD [Spirochaetota bacterium]